MARVSQSKDIFTVLEDPVDACLSPLSLTSEHSETHTNATFDSTILGDLDVSQAQNRQTPVAARSSTADSLAYRLDHFHITSPQKTEFCAIRAVAKRPQLGEHTFVAPSLKAQTGCIVQCDGTDRDTLFNPVETDLVEDQPPRSLTPTSRSIVNSVPWAKHEAGEFEYILSVPASSSTAEKYYRDSGETSGSYNTIDAKETDKLYFGCNLLETKLGAEAGNYNKVVSDGSYKPPVFTLLATPIRNSKVGLARAIAATTGEDMAVMDNNDDAGADSSEPRFVLHKSEEGEPAASLPKDAQILKVSSARPVIMSSPRTERIEDSFEALDEFEEQLEALDKVICVERVPSPDKMRSKTSPAHSSTVKRTSSTTTTRRTSTIRTKTTELSRSGSARRADRAVSLVQSPQSKQTSASTPAKRDVVRPASLQPPKPLAKSSRPITRSDFELPGDAVARRLKEEREARLARMNSEKAAAEISSPARTRSTRAPTRPTFELPGEAISRRKREEHQAKLRAQEEEERKRREFKARPIRSNVAAPSNFPRETATSRARQSSKMVSKSESSASPARKRLTIAGGSSPSRRTLGDNSEASNPDQARGRDAALIDSRTRGVSSSTGSTSVSKGSSTVSAEELQMQRRRGREIFKRDNNMSVDRGTEQRERENKAKLARQEAANRSRQLSREWAERRQSKRISNMMQSVPTIPDASANNIAVR